MKYITSIDSKSILHNYRMYKYMQTIPDYTKALSITLWLAPGYARGLDSVDNSHKEDYLPVGKLFGGKSYKEALTNKASN